MVKSFSEAKKNLYTLPITIIEKMLKKFSIENKTEKFNENWEKNLWQP